MHKNDITTNLVGQRIRFRKEDYYTPNHPRINLVGHVRSVYLDPDRYPRYTVEVHDTRELVNVYEHEFRLEDD